MSTINWKMRAVVSLIALSLATGCQEGKEPTTAGTPATGRTPSASGATPSHATNADLPGASAVTVAVQTVGNSNVVLEETFTASILAAKEVNVQSRIQGNLDTFSFREGSHVAAGQVLFTIDPRSLQAAVQSAEAQVMRAKADLQFARTKVNWKKAKADQAEAEANLANQQREVDRYKPLAERSIIPQQLYDTTVSARDVAKAQLDAAKANVENTAIRDTASIATSEADLAAALAALDNAQVNLSYTTISAPISGVIGELNVYPGNLVSPGQDVLATISSTDPIYVEFAISEADYLALSRKREASGTRQGERNFQLLLADGKPYESLGRFSMVDRAVDAATGTIKVRLEYDNPRGLLRPGEFANVRLNRKDVPDALLVPLRAVQELQSSMFVYVVNADNQVEQREITVGDRHKDSYVVKTGLKAGERVIVDGLARVKVGMTVVPEEAK
jgi:RND family efflux transporter MFP subunit